MARVAAGIYFLVCRVLYADFAEWRANQKHVHTGSALIATTSSELRGTMNGRKNFYSLWLHLMEIGAAAGCHQRPERSFFFHGWQFPVCARCTGVLLGQLLGFPAAVGKNISCSAAAICCESTLLDWLLQYAGVKKSTNARRLITGVLGGFGLAVIYVNAVRGIVRKIKDKKRY